MNVIYIEDNMGLLTRLSVGCDDEAVRITNFAEQLNFVENVVLMDVPRDEVVEMLNERLDTEMMRVQMFLEAYYRKS
jgi:hypothetical protein